MDKEKLKKLQNKNEEDLSGKERYELEKYKKEQQKKKGARKDKLYEFLNKFKIYGLYVFVAAVLVSGIVWYVTTLDDLPPTSARGHIEQSPPSHVISEPIPESIQRHMLEHADGEGPPGVLVQYNCKGFECSPDLVEKLTSLVKEYENRAYLAPNDYDGKIILTRRGERRIVDEFAEDKIKDFIEE